MTLGDLLVEARERRRLGRADLAHELSVSESDIAEIESGESDFETWGRRLAALAVHLKTPTSRLLAESGKSRDVVSGKCGELVRAHREKNRLSQHDLADLLNLSADVIASIENGDSPIETYGPLMLRAAEILDTPIFNLIHTWDLELTTA